ncbi:enoyl-CoA hydratase [Xylanimonas allomyrinae]|uniref:Enoyl-CoA hydratase n=1 Tax=Xylanimonas allomyrinae TaxID=2509459 RepID=A0A4P6EKG7_9MICO|nr:enoyl-CoA hydratase-related protein [Xylanimonas allomyrinae]QAY62133.1 enoyl-CoA hydratase [Xylanimonas allomyrinae]
MPADEARSSAPAALYDVDDGVAVITLNRPHALNAVNAALSTAVGHGLERAAADPGVGAVVVTGAGRAFCAGADLKELALRRPITADGHPEWGLGGIVRHWIDKPLVAAVHGYAMGGGTEIALACDLVVAAESATFGLPEVTRGLFAAAGGVVRLQRQVPLKRALELVLLGDGIDAATAREWGLVNRVVPAAHLQREAIGLARRIAANAPLALRHAKRMVYQAAAAGSDRDPDWTGRDPWEANDEAMRVVFASADAAEGARAFAEKREPRWSDR